MAKRKWAAVIPGWADMTYAQRLHAQRTYQLNKSRQAPDKPPTKAPRGSRSAHQRHEAQVQQQHTCPPCPVVGMGDIVTLPDGRVFPAYGGRALSWSVGIEFSTADEKAGYPKTRAIIRAFMAHRPEQLEAERRVLLRASFDRVFGGNAKRLLGLIEEEMGHAGGQI